MKHLLIAFPSFIRHEEKEIPLTPLMITTLIAACEKQSNNVPFGPTDIKGSFVALVNRGLILWKDINLDGTSESRWQVSSKAIRMLINKGIKIDC